MADQLLIYTQVLRLLRHWFEANPHALDEPTAVRAVYDGAWALYETRTAGYPGLTTPERFRWYADELLLNWRVRLRRFRRNKDVETLAREFPFHGIYIGNNRPVFVRGQETHATRETLRLRGEGVPPAQEHDFRAFVGAIHTDSGSSEDSDPSDKEPIPPDEEPIPQPVRAKNIIFQGPPGTGKTRAIQQIMRPPRERDEELQIYPDFGDRFVNVTFHPSYSYEEFVIGIRPGDQGQWNRSAGIFTRICYRAIDRPNEDFAIFIDEFSRANLNSVLGELIALIEIDKRLVYLQGHDAYEVRMAATLPGLEPPADHGFLPRDINERDYWARFAVPPNLWIFGTMNSADRSVTAMDAALRRRFEFIQFDVRYEILNGRNIGNVNLGTLLQRLNDRISAFSDPDSVIGHYYFLDVPTFERLQEVFKTQIVPLLQDRFHHDPTELINILPSIFERVNVGNNRSFIRFRPDWLTARNLEALQN